MSKPSSEPSSTTRARRSSAGEVGALVDDQLELVASDVAASPLQAQATVSSATTVNFRDLERESFVDLLPVAAQPLARAFGGWVVAALGVAITAAITLLVARALGK